MENTSPCAFLGVIYRGSYGFVPPAKIRARLKDSEFLLMQSSGLMKSGTHPDISNLNQNDVPSSKTSKLQVFCYLRVNFRQLWQEYIKEKEQA